MNVTKSVIEDLLPLYAAGELSEDSRKLVDGFLAQDPAMRSRLKAAVAQSLPQVHPPASLEAQAVGETRKVLRNSNYLWALSFGVSYLAFTSTWSSNDGWVYFLARDNPPVALLLCAFGLAAWLLLMRTKSRLQNAGLEDTWHESVGMFFASFAISIPLAVTLGPILGFWASFVQLTVAIASVLMLNSQRILNRA